MLSMPHKPDVGNLSGMRKEAFDRIEKTEDLQMDKVSVQGGVSPRRRRQLMPTPLSCAGKSDGAGWPSVAA